MQSTRSFSTSFWRISPSPLVLVRHGAVGEDEAGDAVFGEFAHHVENPGVVGIAGGRGVVAVPASVVDEFVGAAPVLQVEGRDWP